MPLSVGKLEYTLGDHSVRGRGFSWSSNEVTSAFVGAVADIAFDKEGNTELTDLLDSVVETDFESEELRRILAPSEQPEQWRIGEALAEIYLKIHHNCSFPWPDSRDARKARASLPGADLVGFRAEDSKFRFVFGEVKTSSEEECPPQLMYGRTGLKKQLEDLKDRQPDRDQLVLYLGMRARSSSWESQYKEATKAYLGDSRDVVLYGLLIRDITPNSDDLRARVESLCKNCPPAMAIDLVALYLPSGGLEDLTRRVIDSRESIQ